MDRRQSLAAIPALNEEVRVEAQDDGRVMLYVPVRRRAGFLARFQPAVMEKRIRLEELGSFVFGQIDGRRTTQDIIEAFLVRYQTNRREAELSTAEFLRSLVVRNVVSLGIVEDARE